VVELANIFFCKNIHLNFFLFEHVNELLSICGPKFSCYNGHMKIKRFTIIFRV
jgi:hypothetical protein